MYNSERPNPEDLPSTASLIRSTLLALVSAAVISITIVLPSEYGIDPTGVGRALGLAEMGEIKVELEAEAAKDLSFNLPDQDATSSVVAVVDRLIGAFFISSAAAQTTSPEWTDEIKVDLTPGQGAEIKLVMKKGAKVEYSWVSENGRANYDLHGDGSGTSTSYKKGRGVPGDSGVFEAAFDGNHGWFWRNRDKQKITVILRVRGAYSEVKKYL